MMSDIQLLPRQCDRVKHVPQLLLYIDVRPEFLDILGCSEWIGEGRSWVHEDLHAQCLGHDEDIGEDDRCIEESTESTNGLKSDLLSEFWCLAYFEEFMLFANFSEFWSSCEDKSR